ncbi:GNAT family N-acetyltransferase [Alkalicella caledoniensis]|uniref:GNAT family N-acetyltransferase n=1 Tax=Alkalicella caledoniensis TaxID=2731377 RepID=A0A7G9W662_ALKCA|nr:GNAT family N-acetyltransferase [Alkalicella caledoniensis]QNO14174.1 GNAT family N-acetyltransferase [Alkalicella caledoniensis]
MIKLSKKDYFKVLPLVNEVTFNNLFAKVVVEDKVEGEIYVDSNAKPTVCLVIHKYGMSFLCGNYLNESFNDSLIKFLNNSSLNTKGKWMLFHPNDWESIIASLLNINSIKLYNATDIEPRIKENYFLQTQRVNFKFRPELFQENIKTPDGLTIKRIDEDMYDKICGSVIPQYFWNSRLDFLQKGIGFSLVQDDKVISTSFASLIADNTLELGVETSKEFRNKGLSIFAATELINYCLSNSLKPLWSCRSDNLGSFKLAQKLGFRPESYHIYYCLK